ncbi:dipeptide epimerase [Dysgonomonas sp. 216]|nr:dipeptide epimerase [Dysgonomonas sp. 216]NDW17674.1 dipeptide epimerase [Dysgonomonas sp. 216]
MKELKLSFEPYNLQLKHPFIIANYSRTTTPIVLTRLEYDGLVGYGEASLPQYLGETQESVMRFLRKIDFSRFANPLQIEEILNYVDKIEKGNTAAKASVDIALHDLTGKMIDKPWHSIWGLDKTKTPFTTFTIGMDVDEMVRQKTEEVAEKFKILKVKLGGENDKRMVEVIRSVTNLPLVVDANQGWQDRSEALDMINWLSEKGVVMIEQPMNKDNLDDNAWITQNSPLPVFADESVQRFSDLERIKGAFSGINVKLMKCTGMHEAKKMLDVAPSLGFKSMLGCMTETSCAISAAAQLSPLVDFADLDGNLLISNDCFDGVKVINGKIELNDLSGVGINLLSPVF